MTETLPAHMKKIKIKKKKFHIKTWRWPYIPISGTKLRTLTTSNANQVVEQKELSLTVGGNVCTDIWEEKSTVLTVLNIALLYDPVIIFLVLNKVEKLSPHKSLHKNIYKTFIHKYPKLGTIQCVLQ
jgi:hypothetical protein